MSGVRCASILWRRATRTMHSLKWFALALTSHACSRGRTSGLLQSETKLEAVVMLRSLHIQALDIESVIYIASAFVIVLTL